MNNLNINSNVCYVEVHGATGGDEAKIWAADLMRMYLKFASKKDWKIAQIGPESLKISGDNVFNLLKYESGVHRVQRVPETEKRGRVHTSTAVVTVLPQISRQEVQIDERDLDWQFYRSSGAGGQNVNKVSTAVRLTHKPTGIVVTSQTERRQDQNRQIALEMLRGKLWREQEQKKEKTISGLRSKGGSGRRSEKIRTYNFPQNRVTDHRINKKWGNLDNVIDGDLDRIIKKVSQGLN